MRFDRWLVLALALVGSLTLAACGGGGGSSSTSSSKAAATGGVKQGGSITIVGVGPDSFDPQEYQTVQADSALSRVYVGLLAFKDATGTDSTKLVPALADNIPAPTNGGKTYTFHIRKGLKYSDGEPVRPSDVVNMLKRNLFLGGPFSSFYSTIEGVAAYSAAKKPDAPLTGMKADDATGTLTINLTKPDTRILYAFAIGEAGVGPKSKALFKNMTGHPFPGAGPYKLQLISPSPTHGKYILTKNPNFNIPTLSKGNVDKITGLMSTNVNKMTEDIISGKADYTTEDPVGGGGGGGGGGGRGRVGE
jgi:peptide/nickel transport system substrate-binding protein